MVTDYNDEEMGWLLEHVRGFVRQRKARLKCKCATHPEYGCFPTDDLCEKFLHTMTQGWAVRDFATITHLTFWFFAYWKMFPH